MNRCRARQRVRATRRAVWCALPCDSSQPVTAHRLSVVANSAREPASCGDSPRPSFPAAPETSPYPGMAWDGGTPSPRCDDASKLAQLSADNLRALQTSALGGKPLSALRDGRKRAALRSRKNIQLRKLA